MTYIPCFDCRCTSEDVERAGGCPMRVLGNIDLIESLQRLVEQTPMHVQGETPKWVIETRRRAARIHDLCVIGWTSLVWIGIGIWVWYWLAVEA